MKRTRPHALRFVARLGADRRGATALEYGLILALVFLVMLGALNLVASSAIGMWNNTASKVQQAR